MNVPARVTGVSWCQMAVETKVQVSDVEPAVQVADILKPGYAHYHFREYNFISPYLIVVIISQIDAA